MSFLLYERRTYAACQVLKSDSIRVDGDLDQCLAKMRRAGLGELAAAVRLAGFVDDRVEPGQPRDLIGAVKAARLADLGEQVRGEDRAGP